MSSVESSTSPVAQDFEGPGIRRICDVVMKGGITSGIVYPTAICKLATAYIVKNIGGTSVGAIAAAITAAAEYRRRQSGTGDGYVELGKLPQFLGRPGNLLALFAADPQARSLLKLALIPIGNAAPLVKLGRFLVELVIQYLVIPLVTIALIFGCVVAAAAPLAPGGIWRCLLVSIILGAIPALFFIAIWVGYRVIAVLGRNSFGWCHGYSPQEDAKLGEQTDVTNLNADSVPPLFNWLDAFIAQAAGRDRSKPLTFGDLWSAKEPTWHEAEPTERGIDFRMVTTCLTLGRPFQLPFDPTEKISQRDDPSTDFDCDANRRPDIYFCKEELEDFFAPAVVEHMTRYGARIQSQTQTPSKRPSTFYRFPAADKVPIIVATRLSMSFPVLFCALPLYALDATGELQRIWFSDGGLTSNFPIHFFDCPLPRWPTFAIDLLGGEPSSGSQDGDGLRSRLHNKEGLAKYVPGSVFIESEAPRGTVNPWDKLDRGGARGNVLAFASSIIDAARCWQDVTLGSLPGNASRIVAIRLSDDEGGLNLNMPPETIETMTELGREAGSKLVDVFATGAPDAPGWKAHRWLRYRATMGAITRWTDGFIAGYAPFAELASQEPYRSLIVDELGSAGSAVLGATQHLASLPIVDTFSQIEELPIAVLATRPVV